MNQWRRKVDDAKRSENEVDFQMEEGGGIFPRGEEQIVNIW